MNVSRRAALKQFVIIAAGAALLPSCLQHSPKKIAGFEKVPIDEDQLALMGGLSAIIIPDNGTPGAKAVKADMFALQMLNDCYRQEDRDKFLKGMELFTRQVDQQYKKPFTALTPQEQVAVVTVANAKTDNKDDATYFFHTLKHLTIEAYGSSEYFLTKVQEYKLVPGAYIASKAV